MSERCHQKPIPKSKCLAQSSSRQSLAVKDKTLGLELIAEPFGNIKIKQELSVGDRDIKGAD